MTGTKLLCFDTGMSFIREFYKTREYNFYRYTMHSCTAHNTHAILGYAATPPHNKLRSNLTECFNINCNLPDDGRRRKQIGSA